ncbi:MAG: SRPBCC family protein [Waterburya sp.]
MKQVKLNIFYPHPPEKVWQALTDCRILNAWMMNNDFEPCLGHKFKFESNSLPGIKTIIHCEVVELEKPTRLAYTWQDEMTSEPSLVTWILNPVEGGTQLQLQHQQTGYATTFISSRSKDFRQIDTHASLYRYEQPVTSTHQQILETSFLQLATRNELKDLLNHKSSKEEWDYRLQQKLMQVLER